MMQIFISYAHEDTIWCERLVRSLQPWEPNLRCWYDRHIMLGDFWRTRISRRLDAADIMLVLVSDSFQGSGFCKSELQRAKEIKRQRPNFQIIPIWVEPSVFGDSLGDLQHYPIDRALSRQEDWQQALVDISNKIAEVAGILSNKDRRPDLERDPSELRELLHALCDRGQQSDVIDTHEPDFEKPVVIITRGVREDLPLRFISRMERGLLPSPFRREKATLLPGFDPRFGSGKTPKQMFLPSIRRTIGPEVADFGPAEINLHLRSCGKVILLPATVTAKEWGTARFLGTDPPPGEIWLNQYLDLWRHWPTIATGYAFIAVVSIVYDAVKSGKSIDRFVEGLKKNVNAWISSNVLVLPPFQEIDYVQMEKWVELLPVQEQFKSWQTAQEALRVIFPEDGTQYRLQPLAEQQLPVWLNHCEE